jgi:hypothetical protein
MRASSKFGLASLPAASGYHGIKAIPASAQISINDQINNMIAHFDHMGVVESWQGPTSGPFPQVFEVERGRTPFVPSLDRSVRS